MKNRTEIAIRDFLRASVPKLHTYRSIPPRGANSNEERHVAAKKSTRKLKKSKKMPSMRTLKQFIK